VTVVRVRNTKVDEITQNYSNLDELDIANTNILNIKTVNLQNVKSIVTW